MDQNYKVIVVIIKHCIISENVSDNINKFFLINQKLKLHLRLYEGNIILDYVDFFLI